MSRCSRRCVDNQTARNFGLIIAYVVPGFSVLVGLSFVFEPVATWLSGAGQAGPSVGSFLYVVVASIAAGMTAGALRWVALDTFHEQTGLPRPRLDESRLHERLAAYDYLVECHYRYYQFYGGALVATLFTYGCWRASDAAASFPDWSELALIVLVPVFFAGSRDCLKKYYAGGEMLLGTVKDSTNDERQAPSDATVSEGPGLTQPEPCEAARGEGGQQ